MGVLMMAQEWESGLSDSKLVIATEIQQLLCQQVETLNRALEPNESVLYADRNARIRDLFARLGCPWA
jgi:hypothetical protein